MTPRYHPDDLAEVAAAAAARLNATANVIATIISDKNIETAARKK